MPNTKKVSSTKPVSRTKTVAKTKPVSKTAPVVPMAFAKSGKESSPKVTAPVSTPVPPPAPAPVVDVPTKPVPPIMAPNYLKKVLVVMIPVTIIGFLIISISVTFGQSDAGIAVGVLEGCLILIVGLLVVYFPALKGLYNSTFGKRKKAKLAKNEAQ